MRVAAVDIGTNTVRHLVADVDDGALVPVVVGREITRLGQGVDADRRLHAEAVERTLAAIVAAVVTAREQGAERIRVVGTSALRDAADRDAFARAVSDRTGETLDIISGNEEGRLSMLGATFGLPDGDYTVCDIGGGSTELATSRGSVSLDIGSVRLRERCLHDDPPTVSQVDSAREMIDEVLSDVSLEGGGTLVGVAGTITTIAAMIQGAASFRPELVHHSRLSVVDVVATSERLLLMPVRNIAALGTVERGRADVIAAGSLILRRVMEHFGFEEVLVSVSDILDGLVLDQVR